MNCRISVYYLAPQYFHFPLATTTFTLMGSCIGARGVEWAPDTGEGVCWDSHRKPARASGSWNLLPLHSSQSKHVCACDSHQSLEFLPPSWFSIHLRALVFLLLDSRPGMPNLGFESLITQGVSLSPNYHSPLLFSFLQAQALIWSLLLPSYLVTCGSSFIDLAMDESFCLSPVCLQWQLLPI